MDVQTKALRRCDVVEVKGRIDADTVKMLSETFDTIKGAGRHRIVLNMRDVTYISSAGLGELIDTQNACKQFGRGELVLAGVPQRVKEALDLAGLTPLFKMFNDETEAVGSF